MSPVRRTARRAPGLNARRSQRSSSGHRDVPVGSRTLRSTSASMSASRWAPLAAPAAALATRLRSSAASAPSAEARARRATSPLVPRVAPGRRRRRPAGRTRNGLKQSAGLCRRATRQVVRMLLHAACCCMRHAAGTRQERDVEVHRLWYGPRWQRKDCVTFVGQLTGPMGSRAEWFYCGEAVRRRRRRRSPARASTRRAWRLRRHTAHHVHAELPPPLALERVHRRSPAEARPAPAPRPPLPQPAAARSRGAGRAGTARLRLRRERGRRGEQ